MGIARSVFRPMIMFGNESCILTNSLQSKLQTMGMSYLKTDLGETEEDKINNKLIERDVKWSQYCKIYSNCYNDFDILLWETQEWQQISLCKDRSP